MTVSRSASSCASSRVTDADSPGHSDASCGCDNATDRICDGDGVKLTLRCWVPRALGDGVKYPLIVTDCAGDCCCVGNMLKLPVCDSDTGILVNAPEALCKSVVDWLADEEGLRETSDLAVTGGLGVCVTLPERDSLGVRAWLPMILAVSEENGDSDCVIDGGDEAVLQAVCVWLAQQLTVAESDGASDCDEA